MDKLLTLNNSADVLFRSVETEGFVMYEEDDWVRMHIMTHCDTLQYMPQPDIFVAPEN